jgi:hypothetical protein
MVLPAGTAAALLMVKDVTGTPEPAVPRFARKAIVASALVGWLRATTSANSAPRTGAPIHSGRPLTAARAELLTYG